MIKDNIENTKNFHINNFNYKNKELNSNQKLKTSYSAFHNNISNNKKYSIIGNNNSNNNILATYQELKNLNKNYLKEKIIMEFKEEDIN